MAPAEERRPRPNEDRVRDEMKERDDERAENTPPADEDDIENDPAYNPDDPGLKDIKGG
jgi:hypothetical protein